MNYLRNVISSIYLMMFFYIKKSRLKKPLSILKPRHITIGKNVYIYKGARIECYEEGCPSLNIGNDVIIGYTFTCLVADRVTIGDNSIFASNVSIISENHGMDPTIGCYYKQPLIHSPISIGRGCWIGQNVTVLPGVTLGDNVIVGAGSIVTSSFPSNVIIAGSPAKVIKRFNFEQKKWV